MSHIVPFSFESRQVRTLTNEQGEPWFVLQDLLSAMESVNSPARALQRIQRGLGEGFSAALPLPDEYGEPRLTIIVAKAATTYLLARSNTETGRRLNRFVHTEIFPRFTPVQESKPAAASSLVPFQFESYTLRVLTDATGEPLFVAKDVAEALGYANTTDAVLRHCKKAKSLNDMVVAFHDPAQDQALTLDPKTKLIPESDLYRLTMGSKLDSAERFQDWVVEEVLPQIRRTGAYLAEKSNFVTASELDELRYELSQMRAQLHHLLPRKSKPKSTAGQADFGWLAAWLEDVLESGEIRSETYGIVLLAEAHWTYVRTEVVYDSLKSYTHYEGRSLSTRFGLGIKQLVAPGRILKSRATDGTCYAFSPISDMQTYEQPTRH